MYSNGNDEPRINPVLIRHIFEAFSRRQIDVALLCKGMGMGMAAKDFNSPELHLSFRQLCLLADKALRLSPGALMCLDVGSRRSVVSTGALGMALATSPTVADMLSLITRYQHHFGSLPELREEAATCGYGHLVADPSRVPKHLRSFGVCEAFVAIVALTRSVLKVPFHPHGVSLTRVGSDADEALTRFYGAPLHLSQADNRLTLSVDCLAMTLPGADPVVHKQMIELLDTDNQVPSPSALIQGLERRIRSSIASPPKFSVLAEALNMSERTLRRKLAEQGASYQSVVDGVYRKEALLMLSRADLSIADVALALGFSDVRNFRRAFKRWTGQIPTALRER